MDDGLVGFYKLFFGAARDGAGMDGVGVIVIQDEDVLVSALGGADEFSCLVGENLASWFLETGEDYVGSGGW